MISCNPKILLIALAGLVWGSCSDPILKPAVVILTSPEDVLQQDGKWIRPVLYWNQIDFSSLPVALKKEKFIQMLLPSVLVTRHNLAVDRKRVKVLSGRIKKNLPLSASDSVFYHRKLKLFKARDPDDLYERMATHPTSIVLAQAAIESGWGTSRFFTEANNVFGIWSYNSDEDRMRASETRGKKAIFVRSYADLRGSIKDYFITLGRARAYKNYRKHRLILKDPYRLTAYLKNYSELGAEYTAMVNRIIRENDLTRYDSLSLDPSYYKEGSKIIL